MKIIQAPAACSRIGKLILKNPVLARFFRDNPKLGYLAKLLDINLKENTR